MARKLKGENGLGYAPETEIVITAGVSEALHLSMAALLNPGDEALIPAPAFLSYGSCVHMASGVPVFVPTEQAKGFQPEPDVLERHITPKTKLILINSPQNPTGTVYPRETLQGIADLAIRHDLIVVSDEINEKIIFDGEEHISIASLPGMRERTVVLNGFSKAYSMTGWRLGYMAAPKDIISASVRLHQHINTCASSFVQEAGITALKQAGPDVQKMLAEYQRRRDYVVEAINQIDGLSCNKPKGAFYLFINIKELGKSAMEMAEYFLEEAKVAMVPGTAFGAAGEG